MLAPLLVVCVAASAPLERPTRGLVAVDPARVLLPVGSAVVRHATPLAFGWGAVAMGIVPVGQRGFVGLGAGFDHQSLRLHDSDNEWADQVGFQLAEVGQADVLMLGPRARVGTVRRRVIGYVELGGSAALARIQGGYLASYLRSHDGTVGEYELSVLGGFAVFARGGFDVRVWRGLTLGASLGYHPTFLWPGRDGVFGVHAFFAGLGLGWYV